MTSSLGLAGQESYCRAAREQHADEAALNDSARPQISGAGLWDCYLDLNFRAKGHLEFAEVKAQELNGGFSIITTHRHS